MNKTKIARISRVMAREWFGRGLGRVRGVSSGEFLKSNGRVASATSPLSQIIDRSRSQESWWLWGSSPRALRAIQMIVVSMPYRK